MGSVSLALHSEPCRMEENRVYDLLQPRQSAVTAQGWESPVLAGGISEASGGATQAEPGSCWALDTVTEAGVPVWGLLSVQWEAQGLVGSSLQSSPQGRGWGLASCPLPHGAWSPLGSLWVFCTDVSLPRVSPCEGGSRLHVGEGPSRGQLQPSRGRHRGASLARTWGTTSAPGRVPNAISTSPPAGFKDRSIGRPHGGRAGGGRTRPSTHEVSPSRPARGLAGAARST